MRGPRPADSGGDRGAREDGGEARPAAVVRRPDPLRTALRPVWTALAAFGVALSLGFLYLMLFRYSPKAPLVVAPGAVLLLILILLLMRGRRLARPGES